MGRRAVASEFSHRKRRVMAMVVGYLAGVPAAFVYLGGVMRKSLLLVLAVTAGIIACDSPTDSDRVEGLNLPINLSLGAGVLDSISFHLVESADRSGSPHWLQASASLVGNELRIDLEDFVTEPTGSWTIMSPARWTEVLDFGPGTEGTYDFSIHLKNQSDHYQLVIEEGSCWLSGVDGQFSGIDGVRVTRDSGH